MFRATRRLIKLTWAIALALIEKQPGISLRERALWQQKQARRMLRALETESAVSGTLPQHGLVVCNHLSYLDVLVIAAQSPLVFVAKSDVRHWPVIGLLLKSAGTILAERGRPSSASTTAEGIRAVFESGLPVVLFPEGTSSDGRMVLPFKPTLFQIALDCRTTITPAAIHYTATKGDIAHDVCYWGDHTLVSHMIRLARVQELRASLRIGEPSALPANRKDAAKMLHQEVVQLYLRCTTSPRE